MVRTMWAGTDLCIHVHVYTNLICYHYHNRVYCDIILKNLTFSLILGMDIYPLPSISLRI